MRKQEETRPHPQPQAQGRGGGWQRQEQRQQMPQIFRQAPPQRVERREMPQQVYRQPAPQVYAPMMQPGRGNGRGNGRDKGWEGGNGRQRQEERRASIPQGPPQRQIPWSPGWVPPGQIRSAEVHQRNAERKAERENDRAFRDQYRNNAQPYYQQPYYQRQQPYYQQPYYQQQQPYYSGRGSSYGGGYQGYQPYQSYQQYQPYQSYGFAPVYPYASPTIVEQYYDPNSYYGGGLLTYSPLYIPNTYAYEPYSAYSQYGYQYLPDNYYGYSNQSLDWKSMLLRTLVGFVLGNNGSDYYGMQPYDAYYAYSPDDYGYNNYAQYASYSQNYYPTSTVYRSRTSRTSRTTYNTYDDELINTIPVDQLIAPTYGGYSSGLLREVLAQGYEQGYQACLYGRGSRDRRYLNQIYSLDNDYYDPYSSTISENRRVFAEGYAMGYQDAMSNRGDRLSGYARNTDLVSLLMSKIVGIR